MIVLPLGGALTAGRTLPELLAFPPPLDVPTEYVRFSKLAVCAVAALVIALVLSWVLGRQPRVATHFPAKAVAARSFPWWGWVAVAWTLTWWTLAWTRWAWFQPLQHYTFFPLWLGLIVSVNAVTEQRIGTCLMRRAPRRWLMLFAASAACWWTFEWLNRFVRNWHYLNAEEFGAAAYFVHASVCFSTVLPAVAAIAEWLSSHHAFDAEARGGPAWTWLASRRTTFALIVFGCASLFATGLWPDWFYPALWVSPLALLLAAPVRSASLHLRADIARGDWRRAAPWIIASLACGFFWELWNWHSLTKWIYTVPGVDRWHVFEMPALGYAGYLPFGVECLLVAQWIVGDEWRSLRTGQALLPAQPSESTSAAPV